MSKVSKKKQVKSQKKEEGKKEMIEKDVKTAIVVVPEEGTELWMQIQKVRSVHDKAFDRWMPHICLAYPFVPLDQINSTLPILSAALAKHSQSEFQLSFLKAFGTFARGKKVPTVVFLQPDKPSTEKLSSLQSIVKNAFPAYNDVSKRRGEFHPHLTVGQFAHDAPELKQINLSNLSDNTSLMESSFGELRVAALKDGGKSFNVRHIHVITRTDNNTPFQTLATIDISTGTIHNCPSNQPSQDTNDRNGTKDATDAKDTNGNKNGFSKDVKTVADAKVTKEEECLLEEDTEDRDDGGGVEQEDEEYVWKEGDELRDVWRVTDLKQLETIDMPNPNKMPCEATVKALRTFQKRGLKITKLALSWWLTFNLHHAADVADIITIEEAIDIAIRAKHPSIFMILAEYSTPSDMEKRKLAVLEWYQSLDAGVGAKRILEASLQELQWLPTSLSK
jgi:2'-5' RNA ligase